MSKNPGNILLIILVVLVVAFVLTVGGFLLVQWKILEFPHKGVSCTAAHCLLGYECLENQGVGECVKVETQGNKPPICDRKGSSFPIGDYYECPTFNLLYPAKNVMDAPMIITNKAWQEIDSCGGMPGPTGPNRCPSEYAVTTSCKKSSCE
jgi:hypothetical protein